MVMSPRKTLSGMAWARESVLSAQIPSGGAAPGVSFLTVIPAPPETHCRKGAGRPPHGRRDAALWRWCAGPRARRLVDRIGGSPCAPRST